MAEPEQRSAWLARRGELTTFLSNAATRQAIVHQWNAEEIPQIQGSFNSEQWFMDFFEAHSGLRAKLFGLMRRHGFVPPFGAAVLTVLEDEAIRLTTGASSPSAFMPQIEDMKVCFSPLV
jgi:hypothetical protein